MKKNTRDLPSSSFIFSAAYLRSLTPLPLSFSLYLPPSAHTPSALIVPQIWASIPPRPIIPCHCPSSSSSASPISSSPTGSLLPFLLISPVSSVPVSHFHCGPVIPHTCPLNHYNFCASHSHLVLIGDTSPSPCSCFFMLFHICTFFMYMYPW